MFRIIFSIVIALVTVALASYAVDNPLNSSPIIIDANKLEYYGASGEIKAIATGDVEATQDDQKLRANFIEYDYQKDTITASGKVKFFEKTGYIIDADKVTLKDKMKYGLAERISILTPDRSTIKAASAQKDDNRWTKIKHGFYTSCEECKGKPPIWNFTAKSATLDEDKNRMSYKHVIFNYYGAPVLYAPYFSHYTSKAQRQSGFLLPAYGGSSYLGAAIKTPYYLNLAPNYDATITPVITTKRGIALEGEYRHLFASGQVNSKGSITPANNYQVPSGQAPLNPNIRYNFESSTNLALTDTTNIGWQIKTTSDKSYRRNYNYGSEDFLSSRVYNNSYQRNGFYEVQAMSFQNLRPENSSSQNQMHQTPLVMPLFESKHDLHQFNDGSKWSFESNMLKIHRYYEGADSNRFSIKNKWQKSMLFNNGQQLNIFASLRDDLYYYKHAATSTNNNYTGYTSRHIPEVGANWSYPLGKKINDNMVVISPIVSAVATPVTNYNKNIYNEDSGNSNEINDTNIFNPTQFNGIDLVENTPRVSYGLKGDLYHKDGFNANALFGQMYQQRPQSYLSDNSDSHVSDFVGRLKFDFYDKVIMAYQYTLDHQSLKNKTNELSTTYKYEKAFITADLLYYRNNVIVNNIKNRRELYLEAGINDYHDFSFSTFARKSLTSKTENPTLYTPANGFISFGGKAKYHNDCIDYTAAITRDLTRNNDKRPNTSYWFTVSLKNIT